MADFQIEREGLSHEEALALQRQDLGRGPPQVRHEGWAALREGLLAQHSRDPQAMHRIEAACREAEAALGVLATFGHHFHLEEGAFSPVANGWPRRLFHLERAPQGRLVGGTAEAAELGPGWWPTLEEARLAAGLTAQFQGRGGINPRLLPVVTAGVEPTPLELARRNGRLNGNGEHKSEESSDESR